MPLENNLYINDELFIGTKIKKLDSKGRIYLGKIIKNLRDEYLFLKINENKIEIRIDVSEKDKIKEEFDKYYKIRIETYGRICIPSEIRNKLNINKNDKIIYRGKGNYFILEKYQ